jgi:hypothetical protein
LERLFFQPSYSAAVISRFGAGCADKFPVTSPAINNANRPFAERLAVKDFMPPPFGFKYFIVRSINCHRDP